MRSTRYVQPLVEVHAIRLEQRFEVPGAGLVANLLAGSLGLVAGMLGAFVAASL